MTRKKISIYYIILYLVEVFVTLAVRSIPRIIYTCLPMGIGVPAH
jgi:hypothetical protein